MTLRRPLSTLALALTLLPGRASGQIVFDWPIRALPQPEVILTGAGAGFWNPGSLAPAITSTQEVWLSHVDGPDATGVRGMALAGAVDLPYGLRGGLGYWHLGVGDIPRTTTSPNPEPGDLQVAEDVGYFALATDLSPYAGAGASIRVQRGDVAGESRTRIEGDLGVHLRPSLRLNPRFGLSLRGLGGNVSTMGGVEVAAFSLASSRIPAHLAYGVDVDWDGEPLEQRLSLRGSWMEQLHLGMGVSHLEDHGWTPLWMLGVDIGRYSFSVLRESLANNFGPIHFYRAAYRFP